MLDRVYNRIVIWKTVEGCKVVVFLIRTIIFVSNCLLLASGFLTIVGMLLREHWLKERDFNDYTLQWKLYWHNETNARE